MAFNGQGLTMNTLIEDAAKLEYLTSNNQWTKNAAEGKDFGIPVPAIERNL
jgi:hypothetical protein